MDLVNNAVNIYSMVDQGIERERERLGPFIAIYDLQHGKNSMVNHSYRKRKRKTLPCC